MSGNRSWIDIRLLPDGTINPRFKSGVQDFLHKAFGPNGYINGDKIKCPCTDCRNDMWQTRKVVQVHLLQSGFVYNYKCWVHHGETWDDEEPSSPLRSPRSPRVNEFSYEAAFNNERQLIQDIEEDPNESAASFFNLVLEAEKPLYAEPLVPDKETPTVFTAVTRLLHFKTNYGVTERAMVELMSIFGEWFGNNLSLPSTWSGVKKITKSLGLGYEKIDACKNDCVLFYAENKNLTHCPQCGESRYMAKRKGGGKSIPNKVLRYFPIGPRLQRLYMSQKTSEHMRWHSERRRQVPGELRHPADGEAWRHLDYEFPSFGSDPRNVRLGFATDGFNPFGLTSRSYSIWPVILIPYNLPPWMCMKEPYMFMSLLIPGPKSPGRDIDVYLRPLIDELKVLWDTGLQTWDAYKKKNFQMRAAILWTIHDSPGRALVEGWMTHGHLACPICLGENNGTSLPCTKKTTFFGCHRRFLPIAHRWRNNTTLFNKGKDLREPPSLPTGDLIKRWLDNITFQPFGKKEGSKKPVGYGKDHNWTKKSVFFQFPYWPKNLIRHNFDVMHIEKNVFDNVFYTVLGDKARSKDNGKSRKDLKSLGIRKEYHGIESSGNRPPDYPQAKFTLTKEQLKLVCQWVSELKLPDNYASNISKCCNVQECKFYGFKSHDCHVFMQRLLPLAFRDLLPKPVVDALTELSCFFRDLCSPVIREEDMVVLEQNIIETTCKLETIFPPSFFNSMEHFPIHLAREAKIGGPNQFRSMWAVERLIGKLKRKVRNKARVEGSIANAYILEEISNFCSLYFRSSIPTNHTRVARNVVHDFDDSSIGNEEEMLSVFKYPTRFLGAGKLRHLDEQEIKAVHLYILMNTTEIIPYVEEYKTFLKTLDPNVSDEEIETKCNNDFPDWLKRREKSDIDLRVLDLINGPYYDADSYTGCLVNGYRFHVHEMELIRSTANSGVVVKGTCYGNPGQDWYGRVKEIIRVRYTPLRTVPVFYCEWFDMRPDRGIKIDHKSGLVRVNMKLRLNSYEPFILASQATQVYYVRGVNPRKDPNWFHVIKVKARSNFDVVENEDIAPCVSDNDVLQEDEYDPVIPHQQSDDLDDELEHFTDDIDGYEDLADGESDVDEDGVEDVNEDEDQFEDEEFSDSDSHFSD